MYYHRVILRVVLLSIFDKPVGRVKSQTMGNNAQWYYTPKRLISYLSSKCFFSSKSFLLISPKGGGGEAKRIEKCYARSQPVKQVFTQYTITNCPNNHTMSQDICTLFARYLYSSLCCWIIIKAYSYAIFCLISVIKDIEC